MTAPRRLALIAGAALTLAAGGVTASALQDAPQEATPAPDPIGDILKQTPAAPAQPSAPAPAPAATPAAPTPSVVVAGPAAQPDEADAEDEDEAEVEAAPVAAKADETPPTPGRRTRRPVAVVQAIDKITAETMQFEVEVGGRPVRFNNALIFTARACEVSASDEQVADAVAYMDVSIQPRGTVQAAQPRQIFRGWMFASSPAVSGLQHPIYDAWVVGCKG